MTTTADEQYRPGFEAWAKSKGRDITRVLGGGFFAADDYANPRTEEAWKIWLASKRYTSTEPSAIRQAALAEAGKAVERVLWDIENGKDGLPDEVYGAERCRDAIKALRSGGGALPDEAKDAARYRWIRDQWDGSSPWQDMEMLRDGGADLDFAVDTAIERHAKTGSAK